MKKFEKLSRDQMKNVKGGVTEPPACKTYGTTCSTYITTETGIEVIKNGYCVGGGGPTCNCTNGTYTGPASDCLANGGD